MKQKSFAMMIGLGILMITAAVANAQGGAKQGPDINRDPDMEKDSLHHLEVARHYFKTKKAYVAALERCEEIIAGDPGFSKIDEVLFIAGKSSLNLADDKGKQKSAQYIIYEGDKKVTLTGDELRDKARDYLSQLVNEHPQSSFRSQADEDLKALGGPKPKESKP